MGGLIIPARFNGPPASGNGGYTCGALAVLSGAGLGTALEVALRRPPPLDRELPVEARPGGTVAALDGDAVVAEARPATLDLHPPGSPVSVAQAATVDARSPYRDADRHPFKTCFVCGPARPADDGLRMYAGALGDGRHATVFRPDATLADDRGVVAPEVVWAALDCPSSAPLVDWTGTRQPSVLATLRARVDAALHAGEEYVALSWMLGEDGRKRRAGCALLTPDGDVVAVAEALWIELRAPA